MVGRTEDQDSASSRMFAVLTTRKCFYEELFSLTVQGAQIDFLVGTKTALYRNQQAQ